MPTPVRKRAVRPLPATLESYLERRQKCRAEKRQDHPAGIAVRRNTSFSNNFSDFSTEKIFASQKK